MECSATSSAEVPAANRRTFITVSLAATGGLLVAMRTEPPARKSRRQAAPPVSHPSTIQIDPDDRILIWSAQPEMGEGTRTSLPMIVAEELDADWTKVRIDDAPMDMKYGGQGVGGSDAIRSDWDRLRRVGATARALLIDAAAAQWGVPAGECDTRRSTPCGTRPATAPRRYGALAARAATLTVPRDVPLKDAVALSPDRHARQWHRQPQGRHRRRGCSASTSAFPA